MELPTVEMLDEGDFCQGTRISYSFYKLFYLIKFEMRGLPVASLKYDKWPKRRFEFAGERGS